MNRRMNKHTGAKLTAPPEDPPSGLIPPPTLPPFPTPAS